MDSWGRWTAATVQRGEADALPASELEPPQRVAVWAMLRNAHHAIAYPLKPHSGSWRSLGEVITSAAPAHALGVDDVDPAALQRWLRFYGPLYSFGQEAEPFGPRDWTLAGDFRALSLVWTPSGGNDDLSRYDPARFDRVAFNPTIQRLSFLANHPSLQDAARLDHHLAVQALAAHAAQAPMRRCRACGFWLVATRSDRFYCDTACRMQAREGRGERGRFRSN